MKETHKIHQPLLNIRSQHSTSLFQLFGTAKGSLRSFIHFLPEQRNFQQDDGLNNKRIGKNLRMMLLALLYLVLPRCWKQNLLNPIAIKISGFWQLTFLACLFYNDFFESKLSLFRSAQEVNLSRVRSETFMLLSKCPGSRSQD